jgi:predicted nucleic acid-binding protein
LKRIVVDSTVCVNWFMQVRGKRESAASLELLDYIHKKKVYVSQPWVWRAHVASIVVRKRGIDMRRVVDGLLDVEAREQNEPDVLRLAADLAVNLRADMFDTLYHAVAVDRGIELVTANAEYAERAGHLGHIQLLSDWIARSRIAEQNQDYPGKRRTEAVHEAHKKR